MMDARPEQVFKRLSFDNDSPDRVSRDQIAVINLAADTLSATASKDLSRVIDAAYKVGALVSHDALSIICIEFALSNGGLLPAFTEEGQKFDGAVSDYCNRVYEAAGMDEDEAEAFVGAEVATAFAHAVSLQGCIDKSNDPFNTRAAGKRKLVLVDDAYRPEA